MHWGKPKQCHKCTMNNKHKDWRTVIEFTIFFLISCLMNWSPIEIEKVSCWQNTVKVSKWPDIIFISRLLYMYVPWMYLQCMVTLAKSSLNFLFDGLVVRHYTAVYWASPKLRRLRLQTDMPSIIRVIRNTPLVLTCTRTTSSYSFS